MKKRASETGAAEEKVGTKKATAVSAMNVFDFISNSYARL